MEPKQAAAHLREIRTLMERSAVYRRALAPVMMYAGVIGIAGGAAGDFLPANSTRAFVLYWAFVAAIAFTGSLFLVRRQALRDSEPFWSPPARRVARALLPAFSLGAIFGLWGIVAGTQEDGYWFYVPVWCALFGLGVHAAGFFMPRGLKLFGWLFIAAALVVSALGLAHALPIEWTSAHWLMGAVFGGLHLAYGIYLYFTEKRGKTS